MRNHTSFAMAQKPGWLRWLTAYVAALAILLGSLGINSLLLSQASAAELTENIITDASVTKKELNPNDYVTQLNMGFKLPNSIHKGDTSTITLPSDFTFNANFDFDVMSSDGNVVAKAHVDAATGKMTLTYTDYVESHSDITGKITAAIRIKTDKVTDYGKKTINLDVNGKLVPAGEINYGPWGGDNPDEIISKITSADYNTGTLSYTIRVNAKGEDMKQVTVADILRSVGMSYDQSSFKITKGKWAINSATKRWELQNGTDVTASTTVNYTNEGNGGFTINLGDIGTNGYKIEYKVKLNHAPLNGEQFKNRVALNYNGKTTSYGNTATWESGSGEANGYNYSIKLKKTDVNGRALKGAVFSVVRDSSGETVGTITTGEDGTGSLGGLLRDNYTVMETTAPDGYEKADPVRITAEQLKNDAKTAEITVVDKLEEKTSVKVTKAWDDSDNTDGVRPDSVQVQLRADGEKSGDLVTLNEANHWTYTWTGLKAKNNGQDIKYTVSEVLPANGKYTFKVTGDAASGYTITNTHKVEKTSVSISKVWDDQNDQDGVRPDSVKMQLYADGVASGDPVTLDAANGWKHTWSDLDKNASGKAIIYTVKEVSIPEGYTSETAGDAASGYTITNKHTPGVTSVSGAKTWDDNDDQDGVRPKSITVNLLADGEVIKTAAVTAANGWKYSFEGLPQFKDGRKITYTVSEQPVDGYKTTIDGTAITNTHETEKTSVSVEKKWKDQDNKDGSRPSSVSVQLYANGVASGSTVTLDAANSWKHTWSNLDKNASGKAITYTVKETSVPQGYTSTVSGDAASGFTITNSHTPVVPPAPPVIPPTVPPAPKKPHKQLAKTGVGLWSVAAAGVALLLSGAAFILRRKDRGQRNTAADK
ncbi:Cna B-type domain-containing protein [Scardovia wiggsiae]|uniref:Cna B-type domain-containing protein n=2 Tax=Scardovia wiggsiae TaxID=230143 RepID=UPI003644433E